MNEIYQNMLSAYDLSTDQSKRNATFEVNQQIILAGLYQGGFFEKQLLWWNLPTHFPWFKSLQ